MYQTKRLKLDSNEVDLEDGVEAVKQEDSESCVVISSSSQPNEIFSKDSPSIPTEELRGSRNLEPTDNSDETQITSTVESTSDNEESGDSQKKYKSDDLVINDNGVKSESIVSIYNDESVNKRDASPSRNFVCNECGFTTARRSRLVSHIKKHTAENVLACQRCGYTTMKNYNFRMHMVIHAAKQKFSANNGSDESKLVGANPCNNGSNSNSSDDTSTVHAKQSNVKFLYVCKFCHFWTHSKDSIIRHSKRYQGENYAGKERESYDW